MKGRGLWSSQWPFYLATIGSSFGLGNLWRFPYVVGENGGGAFVLLYLCCALFLGLPILIAELTLGKAKRRGLLSIVDSVVRANPEIRPSATARVLKWAARLSIAACLLALSYYAVISGWVLHFAARYAVSVFTEDLSVAQDSLRVLIKNEGLQVALTLGHLMLTVFIVAKGVREGLERWTLVVVPIFLVLGFVLMVQALRLPSAEQAIRFLLYPDFSKLTPFSLGQALGHVLFTASLGFGMMVSFGSYLPEGVHIPTLGFRVIVMDTLASVFAAILIFSIVFGAGVSSGGGPWLLFETLPLLLARVGWGPLWGLFFFLCLYLAALGASIGLLQAAVSNLMDRYNYRRDRATLAIGGLVLALSVFPALSSNALRDFRIFGLPGLVFADTLLIAWLLPLAALVPAYFIFSGLSEERRRAEYIHESYPTSAQTYAMWGIAVRWLFPLAIATALSVWVIGSIKS